MDMLIHLLTGIHLENPSFSNLSIIITYGFTRRGLRPLDDSELIGIGYQEG